MPNLCVRPLSGRYRLWLLAGLCLGLFGPAPAGAETYERAVRGLAPRLLEQFEKAGYRSVGVLKFHVVEGKQATHDAGPLLHQLARRLETALILANSNPDLLILKDATASAAAVAGADHLDPKGGQRALFVDGDGQPVQKFLPSWGRDPGPVAADAFVTGLVHWSQDLTKMYVRFYVLDRKTMAPQPVGGEHPVAVDVRTSNLIEGGASFDLNQFLRSGPDGQTPPKDYTEARQAREAAREAKAVAQQNETRLHPAATLPLRLEVLYDGQPAPVQVQSGKAFVPPPRPGQKVEFLIRRLDDQFPGKYGAVLMVNGVNTLNFEKLPPEQCLRWVFPPKAPPGLVRGFYQGETVRPFQVLPPEVLRQDRRTFYGNELGLITFVVFREGAGPQPAPPVVAGGPAPVGPGPQPQPPVVAGGPGPTGAKPQPPVVAGGPGPDKKTAEDVELEKIEQSLDQILQTATPPAKTPPTLLELKKQLQGSVQMVRSQARGVIDFPDEAQPVHLEPVTFRNPGVVGAVTIIYHRP